MNTSETRRTRLSLLSQGRHRGKRSKAVEMGIELTTWPRPERWSRKQGTKKDHRASDFASRADRFAEHSYLCLETMPVGGGEKGTALKTLC